MKTRPCIECGNFECYYRRYGCTAVVDCPHYVEPKRNIDVLKATASVDGIIYFLTTIQQESFCLGAKLRQFKDKRFPDGTDEWWEWLHSPYNGKDFESDVPLPAPPKEDAE